MIEQLHIFYHSIKADADSYAIFCLFTVFILWQQALDYFNKIGQGYERPNNRKA